MTLDFGLSQGDREEEEERKRKRKRERSLREREKREEREREEVVVRSRWWYQQERAGFRPDTVPPPRPVAVLEACTKNSSVSWEGTNDEGGYDGSGIIRST